MRNRIRAASELVKTGKRQDLQDVRTAMADESFWGVRASVARELGKSGHVEAVGPLADWLAEENEPRVKRALAEACGRMRDARLRDSLLGFLKNDQPPFSRAGALESLGAQRNGGDLELLTSEIGHPHWLTVAGAVRGIGAHGSEAALDFLETQLPYGALVENARNAAMQAYGACASRLGPHQKARARDHLIDMTRDPQWRVRMAAGGALAALGDTAAIGALESLKGLQATQDTSDIERWIVKLRKGVAGAESQALREQTEKLEERCRKLDERIQDLEANA